MRKCVCVCMACGFFFLCVLLLLLRSRFVHPRVLYGWIFNGPVSDIEIATVCIIHMGTPDALLDMFNKRRSVRE